MGEKIRELRESINMSRKEFSNHIGIPIRTVEDWEAGRRKMPDYVLRLLTYKIEIQQNKTYASKNVNIIRDECGKSIVIINDVRFKSRRNINWDKVEEYLKLFGAIVIEGPKYCGKTWVARYHSNSEVCVS